MTAVDETSYMDKLAVDKVVDKIAALGVPGLVLESGGRDGIDGIR